MYLRPHNVTRGWVGISAVTSIRAASGARRTVGPSTKSEAIRKHIERIILAQKTLGRDVNSQFEEVGWLGDCPADSPRSNLN